MKAVGNKTQRPVSVPLPRGKTLHLGPGKTGQIASNACDHPPLKKLIEAGQIEILDEHSESAEGTRGGKAGRTWMPGHASGSASRRSGDR
jgi:hypothetical protein